jgi:hypothetical protein
MKAGTCLKLVVLTATVAFAVIVSCGRTMPASPISPGSGANAEPQSTGATVRSDSSVAPAPDIVFAGAGDIGECGTGGPERTARLLDRLPGYVFALGDTAYPRSTAELIKQCYDPAWGRHRDRTYASPGNHDWEVDSGAPYFAYFGTAAGPPGAGYYSVDLGSWHVISLNSNIAAQPGSPQYEWAKRDVAASAAVCTLALWHHPVFSSGGYGPNPHMKGIWQMLDEAGVDLVVSGHEHDYERFAPQDADGRPNSRGMRQFIVGTGGAHLRPFGTIQPNSDVRIAEQWGVLRLLLRASSYEWEFMSADGVSRDTGASECVK